MAKKNYYAVVKGRISEPTIFSSWGDAHPHVTNYPAAFHRGFKTLDEARTFMRENEVFTPKEVIKQTVLRTTSQKCDKIYYAIANGADIGVHEDWYGVNGALALTAGYKGACHKSFRTKGEALAFIEDRKDSVADLCRTVVKEEMDCGLKPQDMDLESAVSFR